MTESSFSHDVFLSHSSKDKAVVRSLAERLRADGLRVWLDDWEIHVGDNIPAKIEEGLERSRVLVLCVSELALSSDWAALESQTFRFRDPLNKERRFIPLRLDDVPISGSLAQFLYVDWRRTGRKQAYAKLLEACRPPANESIAGPSTLATFEGTSSQLNRGTSRILTYAFRGDGIRALTGSTDHCVRLWNVETGTCLRVFEGHDEMIYSVAWSVDYSRALSGADDRTIRLWNVETGNCIRVLTGHTGGLNHVAWSDDQRQALSSADDRTVRLWDLQTGRCVRVFEGHTHLRVLHVAWSPDQRCLLSCGHDKTVRLWDIETGRCLRVLEGHTGSVRSVAWSPDQRRALSGSNDTTIRLWDVETGRCLRVLEGHGDEVWTLVWWPDQRYAISGAWDKTLRVWDVETGRCVHVLEGHTASVYAAALSADQRHAYSGDDEGGIRVWPIAEFLGKVPKPRGPARPRRPAAVSPAVSDQVQYTNAKVLVVGESGAGKTGLSQRLAADQWQPSDSTVGAWATQWKLPVLSAGGIEREIWLWDFGGQADQRLIHQLYMDDAALAVLVFDGQKEDLFETLGQWDRDLTRASRRAFAKLLVAGRVDAGGLRVASRGQIEAFAAERGFRSFLETSAKTGEQCVQLKQAILDGIQWDEIPCRTTLVLSKRLKDEIVLLKDAGRVLMRFNELREALTLSLAGEDARFTDEELKAVVGLLSGPGVVWELKFGSWVLLQPERINAYAQAVIQTMRKDEYERGCLLEERVLGGDLAYTSSMERLSTDEERFVLLAMHQTLVERGLCLREHTDQGALLVFPSYYRRERPELIGHPAVLVSYRFSGFLDDIYATLVVRLHHTGPFQQDKLWRYAADFKTLTGRQLGVKLTRRAEGAGELDVYFEPMIPLEEKIIFSKYVHEHLLQNAQDVIRLRHYVCPHCGTPVGNREVAMKKLQEGKKDIPCVNCDDHAKRIPLWDRLEELFASPEIKSRVRELEKQSAVVLDSESKERVFVGEVVSTVALAGQICREFNVSDHGIDMEVEFKSDIGKATGQKVYLQLKSGNSFLKKRKSDDAEIFSIEKERHADYWREQAFPVILMIRNSQGEIRWMEVRDYLRRESDDGKTTVKQIVFQGERFDVMSVRRWRDEALDSSPTVG